MAATTMSHDDRVESVPPSGEDLVDRLFGLVMAGVVGVIALMIVMGGWG